VIVAPAVLVMRWQRERWGARTIGAELRADA
jgi:hypothetical protein